MSRKIKNNQITISGEIISDFSYSHEIYGERFYSVDVKVQRLSDTCDIVPVMVSERLIDVTDDLTGLLVCIEGNIRSYNWHEEDKSHLLLSVFARSVEFVDGIVVNSDTNKVYLDGFVCKEPRYRTTPLGREITDVLLAVNRPYGKSDYVPCIIWGRNARYASNFKVGERCAVWGRLQSREYEKKLEDETAETRTAYELSVSKVEVL